MFSNYLLLFIFNNIKILVYILKISYGFAKTWVNNNRLHILSVLLTSVKQLWRMPVRLHKSNKPHCEHQPNSYQTVWAWLIFGTCISSIRREQCAIFNTLNSSAQERLLASDLLKRLWCQCYIIINMRVHCSQLTLSDINLINSDKT